MRQGIRVAVPVTSETTKIDAENAAVRAMVAAGATEIREFVRVSPTPEEKTRGSVWAYRATAERGDQ